MWGSNTKHEKTMFLDNSWLKRTSDPKFLNFHSWPLQHFLCLGVLLCGSMLSMYVFIMLQSVKFVQTFCRCISSRAILLWQCLWEHYDDFVNSVRILFWRRQQGYRYVTWYVSLTSTWDSRRKARYKILNTLITFGKTNKQKKMDIFRRRKILRITEWFRVFRHLNSSRPNYLLQAGTPSLVWVTQNRIQPGLEHLQRWSNHSFSGNLFWCLTTTTYKISFLWLISICSLPILNCYPY